MKNEVYFVDMRAIKGFKEFIKILGRDLLLVLDMTEICLSRISFQAVEQMIAMKKLGIYQVRI